MKQSAFPQTALRLDVALCVLFQVIHLLVVGLISVLGLLHQFLILPEVASVVGQLGLVQVDLLVLGQVVFINALLHAVEVLLVLREGPTGGEALLGLGDVFFHSLVHSLRGGQVLASAVVAQVDSPAQLVDSVGGAVWLGVDGHLVPSFILLLFDEIGSLGLLALGDQLIVLLVVLLGFLS